MLIIERFIDKYKSELYLFIVFIIAVSTLIPIFSHSYFTMHDDQHVARLYLLDQAVNQGTLYPRWVDQLGFGYGYPLFNFYPPLIYYVAEFFRSVGFGYIMSIKLMLVLGAIVGSLGIYQWSKRMYGPLAGLVATMSFTYFGYRAITVYVRGAFAEYWALSLFVWSLFALYNLYQFPTRKNALLTGCAIALVILAHPFIAIPGIFFILSFIALLIKLTEKGKRLSLFIYNIQAGIAALALSAFFWLPSMIERAYTLVDTILLRELASYAIHFVYPQQIWFSPWGFGGSVEGLGDGLSFQISKPYIGMIYASALMWLWYKKITKKRTGETTIELITLFFALMLCVSVFLMLPFSKIIWDNVAYLQYLQFPWRFMAFVALFASLFCGSLIYLIGRIPGISNVKTWRLKLIVSGAAMLLILIVQAKYFKPQRFINSTDVERTSFHEIAWRISSSSFEFVPKGVRTKKTQYNTTTLDIDEKEISDKPYSVISGTATVDVTSRRFDYRRFSSDAKDTYLLQVNTFNFPGWKAYIDGIETPIDSANDFKLMRLTVPGGKHTVEIKLKETPIQKTARTISTLAWIYFFSSMYLSLGKSTRSGKKSKD